FGVFQIEIPFKYRMPFWTTRGTNLCLSCGLTACSFARNPITHVSVVVDVHEEILAPFGTCFCVVTKHDALELHAQRALRRKQRHTRFSRSSIALAVVARNTRRHDVDRRIISTTRTWQNVIQRQLTCGFLLTAVLTAELVAHVDPQTLHARRFTPATNVDVRATSNHRRHPELSSRRTQHSLTVEFLDRDCVFESHDHSPRDTDSAERFIGLV